MRVFKWNITVRLADKDQEVENFLEYLTDDFPPEIVFNEKGGYEVVLSDNPMEWIVKRVPEDIQELVLNLYAKEIREARVKATLQTMEWEKKMAVVSGGEPLVVSDKTFDPKEKRYILKEENN